jgi:hypothetical protein
MINESFHNGHRHVPGANEADVTLIDVDTVHFGHFVSFGMNHRRNVTDLFKRVNNLGREEWTANSCIQSTAIAMFRENKERKKVNKSAVQVEIECESESEMKCKGFVIGGRANRTMILTTKTTRTTYVSPVKGECSKRSLM